MATDKAPYCSFCPFYQLDSYCLVTGRCVGPITFCRIGGRVTNADYVFISKATYRWETLLISSNSIQVTSSNGISIEFFRPDTSLYYKKDLSLKCAPQLVLQAPLQQFEVGSFLNLEDKERVHKCMQKAGVAVCSNKWW